jgi:hypothetical protein
MLTFRADESLVQGLQEAIIVQAHLGAAPCLARVYDAQLCGWAARTEAVTDELRARGHHTGACCRSGDISPLPGSQALALRDGALSDAPSRV